MFKLPASERLTRWREFRKALAPLSLTDAAKEIVQLWDSCPFSPYYLDPDTTAKWPDPWTLIEENWYCDIAKALGMLYTIKYSAHDPSVELRIYQDKTTRYSYNVVWINNGALVLNVEPGAVVSKDQLELTWKLVKTFNADDLKLDNY